jgi:CBS-domain-containing membrane protein
MRPDVASISHQATIREAVQRFVDTKTNSLVVVDDRHRVIGMLSSIDVIKHVVPDYLEEDKHVAAFEPGDVFVERVKTIGQEPVTIAMSASVKTIQPSHTLIEAAALLAEHRINQLPVVDDHGKLIGYIGRSNLKQAIQDVLRSS